VLAPPDRKYHNLPALRARVRARRLAPRPTRIRLFPALTLRTRTLRAPLPPPLRLPPVGALRLLRRLPAVARNASARGSRRGCHNLHVLEGGSIAERAIYPLNGHPISRATSGSLLFCAGGVRPDCAAVRSSVGGDCPSPAGVFSHLPQPFSLMGALRSLLALSACHDGSASYSVCAACEHVDA
jgi:hypothetical protein